MSAMSGRVMKALVHKRGGFEFRHDYKAPGRPGAGEVAVAVRAASINPVDYKLGQIWPLSRSLQGKATGIDFSGVVSAVGEGVDDMKVGDAVFGAGSEAVAEHVVAKRGTVCLKPNGVTFAEAASLVVAGCTGVQALRHKAGLKKGERVLVLGASGGCGLYGMQIAKALGAAEVMGVCSSASVPLVQTVVGPGVELHAYDGGEGVLPAGREGAFDVIYDTVTGSEGDAGGYVKKAWPLLKPPAGGPGGGRYVAINGGGMEWTRFGLGNMLGGINLQRKGYTLFFCEPDESSVQAMAGWVEAGAVHPKLHANTCFPFTAEGCAEAFNQLKSRRTRGKCVIDVDRGMQTD